MQIMNFWVVMPRKFVPLKYAGIKYIHLSGQRVKQEISGALLATCFLLGLLLNPEDGGDAFVPLELR
jgi:hypothetical protein